jgi:hypothetical protein
LSPVFIQIFQDLPADVQSASRFSKTPRAGLNWEILIKSKPAFLPISALFAAPENQLKFTRSNNKKSTLYGVRNENGVF